MQFKFTPESAPIFNSIFGCFDFKYLMMRLRLVSRKFRSYIEARIYDFLPHRPFSFNFIKDYKYPARNNKIFPLINSVKVRFYRYFPDYNQWIFNYILDKEVSVEMKELNQRRTTFTCHVFKSKPIKKLKVINQPLASLYLAQFIKFAEFCVFKNVEFTRLSHSHVESHCKRMKLLKCTGIQHMTHVTFCALHELIINEMELFPTFFNLFSPALTKVIVTRCFGFDFTYCKLFSQKGRFANLKELDLGHNQIDFNGFMALVSPRCTFYPKLEQLGLEHNKIISSLGQVVLRLTLPRLKHIDLNLN